MSKNPQAPMHVMSRTNRRWLLVAILIAAGLLLALVMAVVTNYVGPLVYVPTDHLGVVISPLSAKGYRDQPLLPGVNAILPWEQIVLYPTSPKSVSISTEDSKVPSLARDGRSVIIEATVRYRIDPDSVLALHTVWQSRYETELVMPLARGVSRQVISLHWPEEILFTQTPQIAQEISTELERRLRENYVLLDGFTITNARYGQP